MSVRRSVFWAFFGLAVSATTGFIGSIIIARLLTPYEFGLNAVAVAMSGMLSVIAVSGADALIVREVNLTEQTLATATTVNALLFGLLSLILLGISFFAGPILGDPAAGRVVRILAIMPLLNILTFRPAAMLQRHLRFKAAALVTSTSVLVNNGVTIGAILLGASYIGPAIGAVCGAAITLVLYAFINPADLRPTFSTRGMKTVMTFGLRMVSVSGAAQLAQHASQIILGRLLGISALGLYARATLLANFMFTQLYGTATRVTFSQMSKVNRETGDIRDTFLRSLSMIITVMWPLLLNLAILSGPVIVFLYGDKWIGAAVPLSILVVAQMLVLVFGMNWELFVIRDRLDVQTRFELTRSVVGIVIFAAGCLVSMTMAAMSRIIDAALGCILYLPWMSRLSGADRRRINVIYLRSCLIALATATPSFVLMIMSGWDPHVSRLLLLGCLLAGAMTWLIGLYVTAHPLLSEGRLLLAGARRTITALVLTRLRGSRL